MSGYDEERIAREEETWTGGKLVALMFGFLLFALVVIYTMASAPHSQASQTGPWDFSWDPFAADPTDKQNIEPSSVSGLVH